MKKFVSAFAVALTLLSMVSCKKEKDTTPASSVQRPDFSTEQPMGRYATIEIRNNTNQNDAAIEGVQIYDAHYSGGKFPLEKNTKTSIMTSDFGKQTLYVDTRNTSGKKSITVVGADGVRQCQNVFPNGKPARFTEVSLAEGKTILLIYNSLSCDEVDR